MDGGRADQRIEQFSLFFDIEVCDAAVASHIRFIWLTNTISIFKCSCH